MWSQPPRALPLNGVQRHHAQRHHAQRRHLNAATSTPLNAAQRHSTPPRGQPPKHVVSSCAHDTNAQTASTADKSSCLPGAMRFCSKVQASLEKPGKNQSSIHRCIHAHTGDPSRLPGSVVRCRFSRCYLLLCLLSYVDHQGSWAGLKTPYTVDKSS